MDKIQQLLAFFLFFALTNARIQTTVTVTTTRISPACPKCGVIAKSRKRSCCGRGGSWFRQCGSGANANLDHTWYEGFRACKTRVQSKRASGGRQSHAAQRLNAQHVVDKGHFVSGTPTEYSTFNIVTTATTMSASANASMQWIPATLPRTLQTEPTTITTTIQTTGIDDKLNKEASIITDMILQSMCLH